MMTLNRNNEHLTRLPDTQASQQDKPFIGTLDLSGDYLLPDLNSIASQLTSESIPMDSTYGNFPSPSSHQPDPMLRAS